MRAEVFLARNRRRRGRSIQGETCAEVVRSLCKQLNHVAQADFIADDISEDAAAACRHLISQPFPVSDREHRVVTPVHLAVSLTKDRSGAYGKTGNCAIGAPRPIGRRSSGLRSVADGDSPNSFR